MVRFALVSALLGCGVAQASSTTWSFDLGFPWDSCGWGSTLSAAAPLQLEIDVDDVDSTIITGARIVGQNLSIDVHNPNPFFSFVDPYASWGFTCDYNNCPQDIDGIQVAESIFFPSTDPGVSSAWPPAAQGPANFTGGYYFLYGNYYTCATVFEMSAAP